MYSGVARSGFRSVLLSALLLLCFAMPNFVHAQAPPPPPGGGGDAEAPAFSPPVASGGTVIAGQINTTNTGVILNVSVPNDPVYEGGTMQPEVSLNAFSYSPVGSAHTMTGGELDTAFDLPEISISEIETALGIALSDGMTLTFRQVSTDSTPTEHEAVALGQLEVIFFASDITAPVIDSHADVTAEATSSLGVIVTYTTPTASDDVDASVTVSCLPASGTNFPLGATTVTCDASDAALNPALSTTFTVNVVDTTAPVITLTGGSSITLTVGDSFTDSGATASDAVTTSISVSTLGSVNTSVAGIYVLTYNASDGAGNPALEVTRTVTVNEAPPPAPAPSTGGGGGGSAGGSGGSLYPVAPTLGVVPLPPPPANPVTVNTTNTPTERTTDVVAAAPLAPDVPTDTAEATPEAPQEIAAAASAPTPENISGFNNESQAAASGLFDLNNWWWMFLLVLAALGLGYWAWRKYREYRREHASSL